MSQTNTDTLEARITRIENTLEIQKLQNKYQQYLSLMKTEKVLELFADHPGTTVEVADWGVHEGIAGARRFYESYVDLLKLPGNFEEHYAICPIIEVAKDGKTAKASFYSPGLAAMAFADSQFWSWGKYLNHYMKIDGEWKIWHLRWYVIFESTLDKGPLKEQRATIAADATMAGKTSDFAFPPKPDKPCTFLKLYSPTDVNYLPPEPPEPFDTWDE